MKLFVWRSFLKNIAWLCLVILFQKADGNYYHKPFTILIPRLDVINVDEHLTSSRNIIINIYDSLPPNNEFNFFISNNGKDQNTGRLASEPKLHLDSIENLVNNYAFSNRGALLGLEANSVFREQFDPQADNINVSSYNLTAGKRKAKITGMDIIRNWKPTEGRSMVYENLLTHKVDTYSPYYSYIMVAEVDTAKEKTNPVSAVRFLTRVSGMDLCEKLPGTYFTADTITNPVKIYIHSSEGVPGSNKFRYEATTRNFSMSGYYYNGARYENLFLQSSGYGWGMIGGGNNTVAKNVTFQGGGTHHIVVTSGKIDSCIFLPGPKGLKDRIAVVFAGDKNREDLSKTSNFISNSIFLDIPFPIYSHTTGGTYKFLSIDRIYSFGDTTDAQIAFSASNTDSVSVSNCYVEGYGVGWHDAPTKLSITNTIFRNISHAAIQVLEPTTPFSDTKITNALIKTNGSDNNQNTNDNESAIGIRAPYSNLNVEASNMIFHGYSTWHQPNATVRVFKNGRSLKAHHNIYICDVNYNNNLQVCKSDNTPAASVSSNVVSDYNVFVLLRGAGFNWVVSSSNAESNIFSLSQWQSQTGQDKHSIFIDLRNNPQGLKAIFVDPDNGNWTFAETPEANAVKNIGAGMTSPPLYYPKRPSYDSADAYQTPEGFSSFAGTFNSNKESVLEWKTFNETTYSYFNVEYSTNGINYTPLNTSNALGDRKNNTYRFIHSQASARSNYYRLRVVDKDSSFVYSPVVFLERDTYTGLDLVVYPNPFSSFITVRHPSRTEGKIQIYDFSGRLCYSYDIQAGFTKSILPLDELQNGIYILQWTSGNESMTKTIITHH